jgi:hypothetical protein
MDAFHGLSQLRASPVWKSASVHLSRVWSWLTVHRDPVDWKGALAKASTWLQLRTIASRVIAGFVFVALLVPAIMAEFSRCPPFSPCPLLISRSWAACCCWGIANRPLDDLRTGVDGGRIIGSLNAKILNISGPIDGSGDQLPSHHAIRAARLPVSTDSGTVKRPILEGRWDGKRTGACCLTVRDRVSAVERGVCATAPAGVRLSAAGLSACRLSTPSYPPAGIRLLGIHRRHIRFRKPIPMLGSIQGMPTTMVRRLCLSGA